MNMRKKTTLARTSSKKPYHLHSKEALKPSNISKSSEDTHEGARRKLKSIKTIIRKSSSKEECSKSSSSEKIIDIEPTLWTRPRKASLRMDKAQSLCHNITLYGPKIFTAS